MSQPNRPFLESLFDFSFDSFVTVRLVPVLFGISVVVMGIYALGSVIAAFSASVLMGLFTLLVLAPLGFLLGVIWVRVILEIAIILFRIGENTTEMSAALRSPGGGPERL